VREIFSDILNTEAKKSRRRSGSFVMLFVNGGGVVKDGELFFHDASSGLILMRERQNRNSLFTGPINFLVGISYLYRGTR
jgi:hypothetical protein